MTFLLPFAASNFIYIAAADLIPEIKHEENARLNVIPMFCVPSRAWAALAGAIVIRALKCLSIVFGRKLITLRAEPLRS